MPVLFRVLSCLCLILVPVFGHAAEPAEALIVGHRGLLRHAPEDTLANFRACLALRIGFEFDVRRTKDGTLVCIHDDTVDRTTDGSGAVSEMTLAEIRKLDAGRWFDPLFAGEKVPTVEEVLKLVGEHRKHKVLIAIDLKAGNVEEDVVKLAQRHRVLDRLLFIGRTITEPAVREKLLKADPKTQVARLANMPRNFPQPWPTGRRIGFTCGSCRRGNRSKLRVGQRNRCSSPAPRSAEMLATTGGARLRIASTPSSPITLWNYGKCSMPPRKRWSKFLGVIKLASRTNLRLVPA